MEGDEKVGKPNVVGSRLNKLLETRFENDKVSKNIAYIYEMSSSPFLNLLSRYQCRF